MPQGSEGVGRHTQRIDSKLCRPLINHLGGLGEQNDTRHTSRIFEIREINAWKNALYNSEPREQKSFIIDKVLEGRMTESVASQLIKILLLEAE